MKAPRQVKDYYSDGRSRWFPPDKEWLEAQLVTNSINGLADKFGCNWRTVDKWILDLGINFDRSRKGKNHPHWKGGTSRSYGRNLLLGSEIPEVCGWCRAVRDGPYSMHVHHKDHDKRNNTLGNLMWLCQSCNLLEARLWNMLKQGKIELVCGSNQMTITFRR